MTVSPGLGPDIERLRRLVGFADQDPGNLALLADAVETAVMCGQTQIAAQMLDRYASQASLTPQLRNLCGHVEMQEQRFDAAADTFSSLLEQSGQDPALKFNLAWCRAMQGDFGASSALLDDATIAAAPRAASLAIEALHHQGLLEEALERGADLARRRPDDQLLMGALATAALDAERRDLVLLYAGQAGDNPDGLAARGMLMIEDDRLDGAFLLFEQALDAAPDNPRALLGRGLILLNRDDQPGAAKALDDAAERFGRHLGTWVAAGWAYFVQGDNATSRHRFETALALDDTFAETHGGLAVLDVVEGYIESARRRTEVALRLDRHCFSAALARSLLLSAEGDQAGAERVRNIAMNVPIVPGGRTIAQAITATGLNSSRGRSS